METKTTEKQGLILTYMALYDKLYGDLPPCDLSSLTNEEIKRATDALQDLSK